ncbi:MAG: universal stress protein [Desulfobacterales bacterium]|nr:universal stress protein [Desulfobacterales bacterium]
MFKNILVPTDLSKQNVHALEVAVNMASVFKGKIYLLHVIETITDASFDDMKEFYMKLENAAFQFLDEVRSPYSNKEIDIETRIVYGNRTEEIIKFAEERKADLIILNSHKIDLTNPTQGWGTISYKIGILSQCPVMLVK